MKKQIKLHNKRIDYTLRKSKRARRVRLSVSCDGSVFVTMPYGLKESIVERFIKEKAKWLLKKISYFAQFQNIPVTKYSRKDYLKHKEEALIFTTERMEKFNKVYHFKFNKITIRNQKTRWGSCSRKGNLNFNYRILFLPGHLANYIIIHELCHLGEFNHSKKFWGLVAKEVPNYLEIKKELKKNRLF